MTSKSQLPNVEASSHRSPSSPLPADALEYFSETAARLGSSGAGGMMIQSPDGRPAGIFFQPKTTSSLGSRTPGSFSSKRTTSSEERFSSAVAANQNRVLNRLPSSSSSGSSLNNNNNSKAASPKRPHTPKKVSSTSDQKVAKNDTEDNAMSTATLVTPSTLPQTSLVLDQSVGAKQAMATFSSNAQPPAASRPIAQPQAGLLIGAGFTPSHKKGGGPKKPTTNMEILPPIKVLIVEDNHINVKILSTFLKQRKIQFGVAKNGREAVDQWQAGGYHLILMDIQLPVMDGIEATKEIRRLERCHNIGHDDSTTPPATAGSHVSKNGLLTVGNGQENGNSVAVSPSAMLNSLKPSVIIVALTASILNSDRVAALAAGCNDFLNKPVNMRWLERKVIEWGSMQYLIGFRDVNDDLRRQKKYQSLTDREVRKSNGLVQQGFGIGPDRLAKEMASRLHIGARKVK